MYSRNKEKTAGWQPCCFILPYIHIPILGAVTKQPLKSKKLLVDYIKSTNNFFVFLSKKGPEGPFSLV